MLPSSSIFLSIKHEQNIQAFSPQSPQQQNPVAQVLLNVGENALGYATVNIH